MPRHINGGTKLLDYLFSFALLEEARETYHLCLSCFSARSTELASGFWNVIFTDVEPYTAFTIKEALLVVIFELPLIFVIRQPRRTPA